MWKEGTIDTRIGCKSKRDVKVVQYFIKVYDTPSMYGINCGRISKLDVRINGEQVMLYDRGWEIEPKEDDEAAVAVLHRLLMENN